jgi:hypothetical protein
VSLPKKPAAGPVREKKFSAKNPENRQEQLVGKNIQRLKNPRLGSAGQELLFDYFKHSKSGGVNPPTFQIYIVYGNNQLRRNGRFRPLDKDFEALWGGPG